MVPIRMGSPLAGAAEPAKPLRSRTKNSTARLAAHSSRVFMTSFPPLIFRDREKVLLGGKEFKRNRQEPTESVSQTYGTPTSRTGRADLAAQRRQNRAHRVSGPRFAAGNDRKLSQAHDRLPSVD